jgi:hypothetical protein
MTHCIVQASGAIELYFYGEVETSERTSIEQHLAACAECRLALDELATIRAALAARPDIASPPGGDWSGFMTRLDRALEGKAAAGRDGLLPHRSRLAPYLAIAALVALVTIGVLAVLNERRAQQVGAGPYAGGAVQTAATTTAEAGAESEATVLAALGEQHFERSKLVVLGLATRDPDRTRAADWAYERELASTLLTDTRLYRQTAEQHGMGALAGVMRDLELVLLETSMSEEADATSLERVQRLIRRRDLITKMTVVRTAGLAP